jgi:hypothetical protein
MNPNFIYYKNINKRLKDLKTKPAFYWENLGKKYVVICDLTNKNIDTNFRKPDYIEEIR